jgi:hypothetical protein
MIWRNFELVRRELRPLLAAKEALDLSQELERGIEKYGRN